MVRILNMTDIADQTSIAVHILNWCFTVYLITTNLLLLLFLFYLCSIYDYEIYIMITQNKKFSLSVSFFELLFMIYQQRYPRLPQTSKIVDDFQVFAIVSKHSILDVRGTPKSTSVLGNLIGALPFPLGNLYFRLNPVLSIHLIKN